MTQINDTNKRYWENTPEFKKLVDKETKRIWKAFRLGDVTK
jgi:hypothetical protein